MTPAPGDIVLRKGNPIPVEAVHVWPLPGGEIRIQYRRDGYPGIAVAPASHWVVLRSAGVVQRELVA